MPVSPWGSGGCSADCPVWVQRGDVVDAVVEDRGYLRVLRLAWLEDAGPAGPHALVERARVTGPGFAQRLVVAAPAAVDQAEPDHREQVGVEAQPEPAAVSGIGGRYPSCGQPGQVVQGEGAAIRAHGRPEVDAAEHRPGVLVAGLAEQAAAGLVDQPPGRRDVEPPGRPDGQAGMNPPGGV